MIKDCFVTTLKGSFNNNATEYLYGIKLKFRGHKEGSLAIYCNRVPDFNTDVVCTIPGVNFTIGSTSPVIVEVEFPSVEGGVFGDIIFKNAKNFYITNIEQGNGEYPNRTPGNEQNGWVEWTTAPYGGVNINGDDTQGVVPPKDYSSIIRVSGAAISGDVRDFGKFIKIDRLYTAQHVERDIQDGQGGTIHVDEHNRSTITGSLDELAATMIEYGRDTTNSNYIEVICNGYITYKSGNTTLTPANEAVVYIIFSGDSYSISTIHP